jgi:hypothetical protein
MGIHPIRNCDNIAYMLITNTVQFNNYYIVQWTTTSNSLHMSMITLVTFYMVQMDNGSMGTMDTRQQRFTETDKE